MCYAITIHKSQGMTIEYVILDPGPKESHSGIFFTGLSRVPMLKNIALSAPMTLARVQTVYKSKLVRQRREWEADVRPPRELAFVQWVSEVGDGRWTGVVWEGWDDLHRAEFSRWCQERLASRYADMDMPAYSL